MPTILLGCFLLAACSKKDEAIRIDIATLECGDQKMDVRESIAAACDGKTSCQCDVSCWTGGTGYPKGCGKGEASLNLSYQAAGMGRARYKPALWPDDILVIGESGDADFEMEDGGTRYPPAR